jgi:hypothetical protein
MAKLMTGVLWCDFLLYTNDIELLGIIQTNSVYQKHGWVAEKWLDKQVDAYEKAYPNLVIHDPNYPKPDVLRSKLYVGDNDSSHIAVDFNSPDRIPDLNRLLTHLIGKILRGLIKLLKYF